ncbi:MFS transporter [Alteromonas ponticola]|uniref:MFS transporter n=1 Tax=Alteromonas ponticola TaxID=2720613 RepID=A0ABX1R2E2_9ALTE|nr:MFS transporter [Alteromonas ponticola]NMH60264.1 MFS transporter [Alteromonas ponticola]
MKSATTVEPEGMIARIMLAFLATAGLFYVNIMPAIVSGLIDSLGFSRADAGLVASFNIYGAAIGALGAVFIISRGNWKPLAMALLFGLMAFDGISMWVTDPLTMKLVRGFHGILGGTLVGVAFAVIARVSLVHKTFGYLLFVQFGLGGLGVMFLPPLAPVYGTSALFLSLIAFSAVSLIMLFLLPAYRVEDVPKPTIGGEVRWRPLCAALLSVFLFQAANMGLYAYIIDLGKSYGLTLEFISPTLGISAWAGLVGAWLVIVFSTRFGRTYPLFIATTLTLLATIALHYSASQSVFWAANVLVGITWAFCIAYLLGICAEFDKEGKMAALGGFASKTGLASGPLASALVLSSGEYTVLINVAAIALAGCLFICLYPTRLLDKLDKTVQDGVS